MDAAKSRLDRLDRVQRSAQHILGPVIMLQSLRIRRIVAALAYLYKLHYTTRPPQLHAVVPPPGYARRSFPFSVVVEWNTLPVDLLRIVPRAKGLQTFKEKVFHHLSRQNCEWSTDSL